MSDSERLDNLEINVEAKGVERTKAQLDDLQKKVDDVSKKTSKTLGDALDMGGKRGITNISQVPIAELRRMAIAAKVYEECLKDVMTWQEALSKGFSVSSGNVPRADWDALQKMRDSMKVANPISPPAPPVASADKGMRDWALLKEKYGDIWHPASGISMEEARAKGWKIRAADALGPGGVGSSLGAAPGAAVAPGNSVANSSNKSNWTTVGQQIGQAMASGQSPLMTAMTMTSRGILSQAASSLNAMGAGGGVLALGGAGLGMAAIGFALTAAAKKLEEAIELRESRTTGTGGLGALQSNAAKRKGGEPLTQQEMVELRDAMHKATFYHGQAAFDSSVLPNFGKPDEILKGLEKIQSDPNVSRE